MHNLLNGIAITVIGATIAGFICHILRQPIILGYVIAGIAIGSNFGLGLVQDPHTVEIISELGLILLLYVIGLEINLRKLLSSGKQLLITSFGQFPLSVLIGLTFFSIFSAPYVDSNLHILYAAILCSLSSTAIVVKGLLDKSELDTLPGRMTLGTLVLQDMYAIVVLAIQPNFASPKLSAIAIAIFNTLVILAVGFTFSKIILSKLFKIIAKSPEMIVCLSIGWCATMSAFADVMGVSREMGALVAGLSIAAFPYSVNITAKTLPLRDFFLTLFFVSLGMKLVLPTGQIVLPVLIISLFVIASRFVTIYPLLIATGAGRRIAFITSLNLSQMSEFALVIGSIGLTIGHINQDFMSLLVFSMVFLSLISSYAIKFSHEIYLQFNSVISNLGFRSKFENIQNQQKHSPEIVFLGFHRIAAAIIENLEEVSPILLQKILVIDFNPVTLDELNSKGINTLFGDIGSLEILKHAHLDGTKLIISSVPDMLLKGTSNLQILRMLNEIQSEGEIVLTADSLSHEQDLLNAGADVVIRPFNISGQWLGKFILDSFANVKADVRIVQNQ